MELPSVPHDFADVISHLNQSPSQLELQEAVQPYKDYETKLRQIYAQEPQHDAVQANHLVPVFAGPLLKTAARDIGLEEDIEKEKYILPLPDSNRHQNGSPATVADLKTFRTNFNVFSEQSLIDLDWSNVVAAGSSVVTSLLPVAEKHNVSKRALRAYYHEELAPASDVDLFIYGLNQEQATEKIKQIELSIRDSVLTETTTIRTKNAITIVSEYPTRHVQIVLRLYNSVTEILTGFDVDCSCVAYDGQQVWASPRALAAFATQQNTIDLTRRSPSYENRLSKYSRRGFEIYWPSIDRNRIDPTIYERSFKRVVGLARLLVLEKLPHPSDRDSYADKRRKERGRPDLPWNARYRHALPGNVKDAQPDDVPDWLEDENHSEYNTFTIPYGPKFNAKKIEKLLFKHDLLLNAEWNKPKDRKTNLHRHPAFFGSVEDVIEDCCGFCPPAVTDEDFKAQEEESRLYISGSLQFIKDNPGRQAIGSFNPLTADDWTDMAYIGSSARLCEAIVESNIDYVRQWFTEPGADVNRRDHTGRTPLHLACMCSNWQIVQELIDRGARITPRIYNGMTALHMAAHRGDPQMIRLLLDRSEANRETEDRKEEMRKEARRAAAKSDEGAAKSSQVEDDDIEMVDEDDVESEHSDTMTEGSFVKVKDGQTEDSEEGPDVYDVDVLAWDNPVSALHLAIMGGHIEVIKLLVEKYGADIMLPIKLPGDYHGPRALLNLMLATQLPSDRANDTIRALLRLGASPAQADTKQISNLHYVANEGNIQVLDILEEESQEATEKVVNHLTLDGYYSNYTTVSPLLTAIRSGSVEVIRKLLSLGASTTISFEAWAKAHSNKNELGEKNPDKLRELFLQQAQQPIIEAAHMHQLVDIVSQFVDNGVDVNTMTTGAHTLLTNSRPGYNSLAKSLLDLVRERIKELEEYKEEEKERLVKPHPLPEFIEPQSDGYQSWILRTNYTQAVSAHKMATSVYEVDLQEKQKTHIDGLKEKRQAIQDMLNEWQKLEAKILEKGAKTYADLHPEKPAEQSNNRYDYRYDQSANASGQNKDKPFENKISFRVPDLTDAKKDKYIRLFEAAYSGDESTIKSLCLSSEDPLEVAVFDFAWFSPFHIAILRGHYNLAKTVIDIAAAQYQPPKKGESSYRYHSRRPAAYESDDDSDDEEDHLKIYEELIDEEYTIDDIRALSKNVKSKTSPVSLLKGSSELWRALPLAENEAKALFGPLLQPFNFNPAWADDRSPWTLFNEALSRVNRSNTASLMRYAIMKNDQKLLNMLLDLEYELVYRKTDTESLQKLQVGETEFNLALTLGRTEIVSEIIRRTGTLLPIAKLMEKSKAQLDEKPEYYQGLSVYGQKRKDWAQKDRRQKTEQHKDHGSPVLAAIFSGNLATVEYFLSETPLRCYEEFARRFEDDKNIQLLAKSNNGIDRALHSWMNTRIHLAIHMAVMTDSETSKPLRDFLIKRLPQYIDAKSDWGLSPLQLAFKIGEYDVAQELLDAGADVNTRDKRNCNLLHTIYVERKDSKNPETLKKPILMLDREVVRSLAIQRCSGDGDQAQTPLMKFFKEDNFLDVDNYEILDYMLELSDQKDLEIMDGAGDYLLHSLVRGGTGDGYRYSNHYHNHNNSYRNQNLEIVKYLAQKRPDLLLKENATGQTPFEIAENTFYQTRMNHPPQISTNNRHTSTNIADVSPKNFLDPTFFKAKGTEYKAREMYDALREVIESAPQLKRDLVALFDANQTARRLAEQQQKQNEEMKQREAQGYKSYVSRQTRWARYGGVNNGEENQDEVSSWMPRALGLGEETRKEIESIVKLYG